MTNGDPEARPALAEALAAATKTPEPSLWVRIVQLAFAGLCFAGAIAVALVLVLHGPPAPKTPDEPSATSGSEKTTVAEPNGGGLVTYVGDGEEPGDESDPGTEGEPGGEGEPGSEGGEGGEESEGSIDNSLADLNEQAPWAFAIVALLVGAFITTGKSLNFNGTKQE
jgi:hypothetical protein